MRRKNVGHERESGLEYAVKQNQKHPIICLPEVTVAPVFTKYQRFITDTQVNSNITIANCLDQFMVQVSTALGICYVKAFRIKKIRLLSPVTTQGSSVLASITPAGVDSANNSFSGIPETYLDTSASIDIPAYIKLTPSMESPLGSWHWSTTTSVNLFTIICPPGSTLDILFEYILNTEGTASAYSNSLVTGTVGTLYSRNIGGTFTPLTANLR
jgi:hypothetical protein